LNQAEITVGPDQIKVVPLKQSRKMDQRGRHEATINTCEINNTNISIEHVKNWQIRQQLTTLINNYRPMKKYTSPIEMKIIMMDETPVYEPPRRMPYEHKVKVDQQVSAWLK